MKEKSEKEKAGASSDKIGSPVLTRAAVDRLIRKAGADRVSGDAAEALRSSLEEKASEVAQQAIVFANDAGRKTVKTEDIVRTFAGVPPPPIVPEKLPPGKPEPPIGPKIRPGKLEDLIDSGLSPGDIEDIIHVKIERGELENQIFPQTVGAKLIRKAGADRVSGDATKIMTYSLEEKASEVAQQAIVFANHAGRKTVKAEDIELSINLSF